VAGEAGGNQIGLAYARTVDTAKRLGVRAAADGAVAAVQDDRLVYFIDGRRMSSGEWAACRQPLPARAAHAARPRARAPDR
jgi:hypothetical protein